MSRFTVRDTAIADLKVVERQRQGDDRGFFSRLFCIDDLAAAGWRRAVVQINQTVTKQRGTIRGMHFQRAPYAEMKLVMCLRGAIWDVAVDLRANSASLLQWHAVELSAANLSALLIPEGFAHGFQALSDDVELLYLHSAAYTPQAEGGLNAKDPILNIHWPLEITDISAKDAQQPLLDFRFRGIAL